jgi:O-antigen ligase/Tfp pilus assembly protein PilF
MSRKVRSVITTTLALYLTLLGGTSFTNVLFWPRVAHHALLTLLLGGWLVSLLARRKPFPATPLDRPLAAYFLVYVLATVFALDVRVSVEQLWELGMHSLLFYLLVDLMRTHHPNAVLKPMFFTAAVMILIGFIQLIAWYFGLLSLGGGWFALGGLRDPIPPVSYRLSIGPLGSTRVSGYLAVWVPVGLAWAVATRSKQTRQMLALWLAGALVGLLLTLSRGGILSAAVSLSVFAFLFLIGSSRWRDRAQAMLADRRVRAALIVIVPALAVVLAAAVIRLDAVRSSLTGYSSASGDAVRLDMWRSAWETGRHDPLTGAGPYGFGRGLRLYRDPQLARDYLLRPDNFPLFVWAEAGIPGVLALAWLAGTVAWAGFRRWRQADGPERVRVAGVCAALLGFSAHNLVDAFSITPNLLPVFTFAAYLVTPLKGEQREPGRIRRVLPAALLALLITAAAGWAFSHRAYYFSVQANKYEAQGDLPSALDAIDTARRLDPALGLYAAQRARYLGTLAAQDETYLPDALAAYREAFHYEDTHDVMHANHAALLARSGDLEAALAEMQRAADIRPHDSHYSLWVGEYAEALGDDARAYRSYSRALERRRYWAASDYWSATPLRESARADFLAAQGLTAVPVEQLRIISSECWPRLAGREESAASTQTQRCDAEIALYVEGDPAEALRLLDRAVKADRRDGNLYSLRSEAHLALGNPEQAEHDARIAIFLGHRRAYVTLARLAEARGDLATTAYAYQRAGPVILIRQGWSYAVYSRKDAFPLLPILVAPSPDPSYLALVELAHMYEREGEHEKARGVYDDLLRYDPYLALEP